jgi:hypothetical protein
VLKFAVMGSHGTVTACTIPSWLRLDLMETITKDLGKELRDELLAHMSQADGDLKLARHPSSGSRTSSVKNPSYRRQALEPMEAR